MKIDVTVNQLETNPAASIIVGSGYKLLDLIIRPQRYYKDAEHTEGAWFRIDRGYCNNVEENDTWFGEWLDELVLEAEENETIKEVPTFTDVMLPKPTV